MGESILLTFYQFVMTYRGRKKANDNSRFADWVFFDHDFPKHSTDYDELSNYLEWNSPFTNAITVFDKLWEEYLIKKE
jgi:uncharacterized protein YozE (UPF0346 family)